MSIIDRNSVLIIGAGVSNPFGVPMGGQMIDRIQSGLQSDRNFILGPPQERFGHEVRQFVQSAATSVHAFWRSPYWGSVLSRNVDENTRQLNIDSMNNDIEKLRELEELLSGQTSETVDDFIVENPSFSEILKSCIGVELAKSTYTYDDQGTRIDARDLSGRKISHVQPGGSRNWVHLLINLVRQALRTGALEPQRKVRIVSFNYDGILESVLRQQFQNTESEYSEYTEYIDIVHPHGVCGEINLSNVTSPNMLYRWSQNICVVNENVDAREDITERRALARSWIADSNQIYAVGFAFSGPNCNMLGLRENTPQSDKKLYYCNYDGNAGVRLAAERCTTAQHFYPTNGSVSSPISVEDWFYSGALGEFAA